MPKYSNIQRDYIEAKKKRIIRVMASCIPHNLKQLCGELKIHGNSFYDDGGWKNALNELVASNTVVKNGWGYMIKKVE